MAFTGVHVVYTRAGAKGADLIPQPVAKGLADSETLTTGQGAKTAPAITKDGGEPMLRFKASAAYYVAFGPNPDAAVGPRFIIEASDGIIDWVCAPGDKVSVLLVS